MAAEYKVRTGRMWLADADGCLLAAARDSSADFEALLGRSGDCAFQINELHAQGFRDAADLVVHANPSHAVDLPTTFSETLRSETGAAGAIVFVASRSRGQLSASNQERVSPTDLPRLASVLAAQLYLGWDESDPMSIAINEEFYEASVTPGPQPWQILVRRVVAAG